MKSSAFLRDYVFGSILGCVLFLLRMANFWMPIIVHLITAYMVYLAHGIIFGIVSLCIPVISEIYVLIRVWINTGVFFNHYTILLLICISVYCIPILFIALILIIGVHTDRREKYKNAKKESDNSSSQIDF